MKTVHRTAAESHFEGLDPFAWTVCLPKVKGRVWKTPVHPKKGELKEKLQLIQKPSNESYYLLHLGFIYKFQT